MKFIIRSLLVSGAGLYLTSWIIPGFHLSTNLYDVALVTVALTLANWLAKPLLKIVLLPLNIASFGLFSIVINALLLFGIATWVGGISVTSWEFYGYAHNGFQVPALPFGILSTYLLSGGIIGILTTTVKWLID